MNRLRQITTYGTLALIVGMMLIWGCAPSEQRIREAVQAEVAKLELPQGPQGERGEQGAQGERGERGEQGTQGPQGAQGERGEKGDTGERGPQGERGEKGEAGAQGERGEKGEKGEAGADGEKGERGAPGPQGEPGVEGPPAEIPASLEVEELIIRIPNGGGYIVLSGGEEGYVGSILWYDGSGGISGEIYAGSHQGMLLGSRDSDLKAWTEVCIDKGKFQLCN